MNDENSDGFNDRLWKAYTALMERSKGKVSQGAIAKEITALGHATRQDELSRWLRGKGRPSYEELPAVARVLGVRHAWLAFAEGPMLLGASEREGPETILKEPSVPIQGVRKKPGRKSTPVRRQRPR